MYKGDGFMVTFGKILRELRNNSKLTQTELANSLGLAFSTISMYERGEREPDFETLEAIADYFNVSMDFLLGNSSKNLFKKELEPTLLHLENGSKPDFSVSSEPFIATNREMKMIMNYRKKPEIQNTVNKILADQAVSNDEVLMFALYGENNKDITPDMLEDVRNFAKFIREKGKDNR